MNYTGSVVEYDGKVLYVFGVAKLESTFGTSEDCLIGVNLDTGKVDEIRSNYPSKVWFQDLSDERQVVLGEYINVYHKLKKNVLMVTAKSRSGKDTLANVVRDVLGGQSPILMVALGDAIRDVRNVLFGQPKVKDRAPLIMIGQGLRKQDPNIWLKVWLSRVIELIKSGKAEYFICQDIRQPNEFSFFRSMGALTVKIVADNEKRLQLIKELDGGKDLDEKILNDETESYADGFDTDITITNNYDSKFKSDVDNEVNVALIKRGW